MKRRYKVLLIVIGLAVVVAGAIALKQHSDAEREEGKIRLQEFNDQMQLRTDELKAEADRMQLHIVRTQFGDAAADLYSRCHSNPPTQERNKRKCAELEEKVKKAEDQVSKPPKW